MKKLIATIVLMATLGACSSVKPLDLADAGTTAVIMAQGGTEMNPIVGIAGDSAAPLVALGLKAGLRAAADGTEYEEVMNSAVDASGAIGACNNLLYLATGLEFATTITFGAICGLISLYNDREVWLE